MLQSFVLGAEGQYLLFSGGPVWLQLGTAFATWRGRDTALVTRVALSPATHSPAPTDLPGTGHTAQVRMGSHQPGSPLLPPVKAIAQELQPPTLLP